MTADERYTIDELRFYIVELELHSVMWFSSTTQPHLNAFVQTPMPILHNYPLMLAFQGQISEESYVIRYNEYKNTAPPASRFSESGIYVYPLLLERVYYKKILMSMGETDFLVYKTQTRLAVPILTVYNALAPGTRGRTVVIAQEDVDVDGLRYLRLGAKRHGVWRVTNIEKASVSVIDKITRVSTPFNVADIDGRTMISCVVVLRHYAGDIALSGVFSKALEVRGGRDRFLKPIPFFITP